MGSANDAYRLSIRGTYDGQEIVNVLHFNLLETVADVEALAETIANACKNQFRLMQVDDFTWADWTAQQVRGTGVTYDSETGLPSGGSLYEGPLPGTLTGADAANDGLPGTVAALLRLTTGVAGRRKRGRLYVAGLADESSTRGVIIAGNVTTYQGYLDTLMATWGSGGTETEAVLGVWSYREATGREVTDTDPYTVVRVDTPSPSTAFTPITAMTLIPQLATQRRRRAGS